jgi:hypothetical protein
LRELALKMWRSSCWSSCEKTLPGRVITIGGNALHR